MANKFQYIWRGRTWKEVYHNVYNGYHPSSWKNDFVHREHLDQHLAQRHSKYVVITFKMK